LTHGRARALHQGTYGAPAGTARCTPDWILDNVVAWSVMGDWISPCYRPHQDVVIPARTCLSEKLKDNFKDIRHVKPASKRPALVAWAGTYWGTGKNTRLRLTCPRGGVGDEPLSPHSEKQSRWLNWDYMNDLNNAIFCPQPTGIAGESDCVLPWEVAVPEPAFCNRMINATERRELPVDSCLQPHSADMTGDL
jgi:hypothetical protein